MNGSVLFEQSHERTELAREAAIVPIVVHSLSGALELVNVIDGAIRSRRSAAAVRADLAFLSMDADTVVEMLSIL